MDNKKSVEDGRRGTSLSAKFLSVFIGAFLITVLFTAAAAYIGSLFLYLGGAGALVMEAIQSFGSVGVLGIFLVAALLISLSITFFIGVPIWIFHDTNTASNQLRKKRNWIALIPDIGSISASIAIFLGGIYLARIEHVYRYWQWFDYAPWVSLGLTLLSAAVIAYRSIRANSDLPDAWWKLRLVFLLITAIVVGNSLNFMRKDMATCSQSVLDGLVSTQSINGLHHYLANQQACRGSEQVDRAVYALLFRLPVEGDANQHRENKRSMLTTFLTYGASLRSDIWNQVRYTEEEEGIQMMLDAVRDTPPSSDKFSEKWLGEPVSKWAEEGDVTSLKLFVSYGLRFDTPDWKDRAFWLADAALGKAKPSWEFYDAMINAGLPVDPRLQALIQAIRTGFADSLLSWTQDDWLSQPFKVDSAVDANKSAYTMRWIAVRYTEDETIRTDLLALAGTDMRKIIIETPLPWRCHLALRTGPEPILATLKTLPKNDPDRIDCERYLAINFDAQKSES